MTNRHYYRRNNYSNFTITKREIILSISIVCILFLIGLWISNGIYNRQQDRNEIYNKAMKIEDQSMFEYGMKTSVGNAFVYGDLKAVDTVTYPEIGGKYMYVIKEKEKYTKHTRTVTKTRTNSDGETETYTEIEEYWTWDLIDSDSKICKEINFCGVTFDSNKISFPGAYYIETIQESYYIRYKYYGTGTKFTGTIFTCLKDKTITDHTDFYNGKTIDETIEYLESGAGLVIFWVFWTIFMIAAVIVFYYFDNRWLEK